VCGLSKKTKIKIQILSLSPSLSVKGEINQRYRRRKTKRIRGSSKIERSKINYMNRRIENRMR